MTLISKNVSIDKLDDIVNKYNNTYHRTIKIKSVVVKDNTYIDFNPNMQPFTKYLKLTLVSMWNSAPQEKFNFCFTRVFF